MTSETTGLASSNGWISPGGVNFNFTGKVAVQAPADPSQNPLNRNDPVYEPLFAYGFGLTYSERILWATLAAGT